MNITRERRETMKGWKDITKTLRVGHYDEPDDRAYIYVPSDHEILDGGEILWFLRGTTFHRCMTHLNGRIYRLHKGRVYVKVSGRGGKE